MNRKMMTNKEKYKKTEDALAAFGKHKEECICGCTFDEWLDMPCDEDIDKVAPRILGMSLAGIFAGEIVGDALKKKLEDAQKSDANGNADEIECPICHAKHGKIDGPVMFAFECPDCKCILGFCDISPFDKDALKDRVAKYASRKDD